VSQSGLAEIVGAHHAGFFPQFAHHRFAWVFLSVDSTLRHLPLKAGENDFRAVVPESPPDQDLTGGIKKRNTDIGTVGFCHERSFTLMAPTALLLA
jgi:hypothetical protein